MTITAAADGSALGNPGPAGWAWYVDDERWAAGGWPHATNNRGELQAVLELFRATDGTDDELLVLCDSLYVINSVTKWMRGWKAKGWRKGDGKPVLNVDLLQQLDEALAGRRYRFEWVKGHANHPLNEAADVRARSAAEAYQRGTAVPSGPGWDGSGSATDSSGPVDAPDSAHPRAPTDAASSAITSAGSARGEVGPGTPRPPEQPGLFDLDEPTGGSDRVISLSLAANEYERIAERARRQGLSVEELVRSLL